MIISIIAGLLTTFLTAWVVSLINASLETTVQRFSIFIIIPIGSMLVGALAASGMYIIRRIMKLEFKFAYLFIALALGLISFFGVTYLDYKKSISMFIEEYGGSASKEQIAKLEEMYTFNQYLERIYKKTTISISSRGGRKATNIDNETVSMISFWISIIGAVAGGFITHKLAVNSRIRRGDHYLDLKYSRNANIEIYQNIKDIIDQDKFGDDLIRMIEESKAKSNAEQQILIRLMKDRQKGDGIISYQLIAGTGKQQKVIEHVKKELTAEQTEKLMMAVLSINPKEKF